MPHLVRSLQGDLDGGVPHLHALRPKPRDQRLNDVHIPPLGCFCGLHDAFPDGLHLAEKLRQELVSSLARRSKTFRSVSL